MGELSRPFRVVLVPLGEAVELAQRTLLLRFLAARNKTLGVGIPEIKTHMEVEEGKIRGRILSQTSVGGEAATTGGHSESISCVASGPTSAVTGAGYSGCSDTARTKNAMQRTGAIVREDSDLESVASVNTNEEDALLRSPAKLDGASSASKKGPRAKPSKEGMKAKARYKAAVKICDRLSGMTNLTQTEAERLAWAKEEVEKGRAYFATRAGCAASNPKFANKVEEKLAEKRQRSTESEGKMPTTKRMCKGVAVKQNVKHSKEDDEKPTTSKAAAAANEIAKKHLTVALIDRSNPLGQMSQERWKAVEMKLLEALFARMDADPNAPMPTFDGAGWFSGVKIIKCKDDPSLTWVKEAVKKLQGLWEGAVLDIVERSCIPSIPKAKVLIPRTVNPEHALRLLQMQNKDVPTDDWKVLKVAKSANAEGSQNYIIQINKTAEDILYARFGKMAWGVGSVFLRLKKRNPTDKNENTLETGEVEKDLGIEDILETSLNLLDEKVGELEQAFNPVKEPKPDAEGSSNKPSQK